MFWLPSVYRVGQLLSSQGTSQSCKTKFLKWQERVCKLKITLDLTSLQALRLASLQQKSNKRGVPFPCCNYKGGIASGVASYHF